MREGGRDLCGEQSHPGQRAHQALPHHQHTTTHHHRHTATHWHGGSSRHGLTAFWTLSAKGTTTVGGLSGMEGGWQKRGSTEVPCCSVLTTMEPQDTNLHCARHLARENAHAAVCMCV